jgi:hypothetical protein
LNDVNVIFYEDLFDETVLRIALKAFGQRHRRFAEVREDPVSGMRHDVSPEHLRSPYKKRPEKARVYKMCMKEGM